VKEVNSPMLAAASSARSPDYTLGLVDADSSSLQPIRQRN